jgi:predicted metalloendopeptidase
MNRITGPSVVTVLAAMALQPAATQAGPPGTATPEFANNFGFPLSFDVSKMDPQADPRQDFSRYAAGRWLDAATVPSDRYAVSGVELMVKNVEDQVQAVLADAAARAPDAARGTPLQQVGDLYTSGMDVARLTQLKAEPIKAEWARIDAIDSQHALAESIARLGLALSDGAMFGAGIFPDPRNNTQYTIAFFGAELPMAARENYLSPDMAKVREAYRTMVAKYHVLAGIPQAEAETRADKILAIESRVAGKQLTPEQARNPALRYKPMTYAALKTLVSNFDVDTYFKALGLPAGHDVYVIDDGNVRERNAILGELASADVKALLQWDLLRGAQPYLTPEFIEPSMEFSRVLYGNIDTPKREQLVAGSIKNRLGHPLGRLYVETHLTPKSKADAEALIAQIRAEFRLRLQNSSWLSAPTRAYAVEKLDRIDIKVGYPDRWIDYSSVDIRRDDYFGNMLRLNEFDTRRNLAKFGKPIAEDGFANPQATLPTVVNAAYSSGRNGIEIPAAFLQPPFYTPNADAGVNYCTLGAVIGHEITHGFDSSGRLYDAQGNVRDWWAPEDAKAFVERSQNLVKQAAAYEVVPGTHLNGELSSGENLADLGGLTLAYDALNTHLKAHPAEDRRIDGLTPQQRCFAAWAQNWADKKQEGVLKQEALTDGHPPGSYRMFAPAQSVSGFYDAYGIKPGDRMWLEPKDRISIW